MQAQPIYDVIIAGAGPAGSTAAYLLSKAGKKVLLIDKSTFPRTKLCAGLITWKTVKLLERVFGDSPEELKKKCIINYESREYEVYGGNTLVARRTIQYPFMFVDRDMYDSYLLEMALNAGAVFVGGEQVRSIDVARNYITSGSGKKYYADIFIGADGVNSRIRRSFPPDLFGIDDWKSNLAFAHELFISRSRVSRGCERPALFFGVVDNGYAWIFPNKDRLKVGICALNRGNRKEILAAFRTFLVSQGIHEREAEYSSGYVLPYGNYLPVPWHNNVMLVGDAAGFADPLLGEGIYYAQRSGECAALSIIESTRGGKGNSGPLPADLLRQVTSRYMQLLQTHILPELEYAGKIGRAIWRYLGRCRYLPLKALMNALGDMPAETVHGFRSYRWMRRL